MRYRVSNLIGVRRLVTAVVAFGIVAGAAAAADKEPRFSQLTKR